MYIDTFAYHLAYSVEMPDVNQGCWELQEGKFHWMTMPFEVT